MADQVTPDKTPEDFEQEMLQTRESLTEKVAALETQVVGSVQTAADTLTHTVDAVKSFVSTAPEVVSDGVKQATAAVSNAVKDTFDVTDRVRRHPWAAVGVSAALGCIAAWLATGRRSDFTPLAAASPPVPATPPAATPPLAAQKPGMLDEFLEMIGDKVKDLARTALESVSAAVKENIQTGVPKLVDNATAHLTDTEAETSPFTASFEARRSRM